MTGEFRSFNEGVEVGLIAVETFARLALGACFRRDEGGLRFAHDHLRAGLWAFEQVEAEIWIGSAGQTCVVDLRGGRPQ